MAYKGDRKAKCREYYQQNMEIVKRKQRQYRERKKGEALDLYGRACLVCGYSNVKGLLWHEKSGKSHRGRRGYMEALKDPDKFVLLCYLCHKGVHWCMGWLGWTWERIEKELSWRVM